VRSEDAVEPDLAERSEDGGDMAVGQRAADGEDLRGGRGRDDGPALEEGLEALEEFGRPVGEVEEGALLDLSALAVGLAQQDGRGRAAVGNDLDVHGYIMGQITTEHNGKCVAYMPTLWAADDGSSCNLNDFGLEKVRSSV
jgi:hypothetical protein